MSNTETATLTTAEIVSRLRALWGGGSTGPDILIEAATEIERLTADRDALRATIARHRENVWGHHLVGHKEDEALYAALAGRSAPAAEHFHCVELQPDDGSPGLWIGFRTDADRNLAMALFRAEHDADKRDAEHG